MRREKAREILLAPSSELGENHHSNYDMKVFPSFTLHFLFQLFLAGDGTRKYKNNKEMKWFKAKQSNYHTIEMIFYSLPSAEHNWSEKLLRVEKKKNRKIEKKSLNGCTEVWRELLILNIAQSAQANYNVKSNYDCIRFIVLRWKRSINKASTSSCIALLSTFTHNNLWIFMLFSPPFLSLLDC